MSYHYGEEIMVGFLPMPVENRLLFCTLKLFKDGLNTVLITGHTLPIHGGRPHVT